MVELQLGILAIFLVHFFSLGILMLQSLKNTWFYNIRGDVLAGLVVALALIPEAIAFSVIAGVDPKVSLYASFCIAIVIAFVGVGFPDTFPVHSLTERTCKHECLISRSP